MRFTLLWPLLKVIEARRLFLSFTKTGWVLLIVLLAACSGSNSSSTQSNEVSIQKGMDATEVTQVLGEAEKISYLDGKVLNQVDNIDAVDFSKHRVVFSYNDDIVHVWFENGKVNSVTRHGVAVQLDSSTEEQ